MTTPNNITNLKENEIFVFGSNLNGNHAGGAAKLAQESFGVENGVGEGLTGQCYAFPTLDKEMQKVSKEELIKSRDLFYKIAEENKDKTFFLTKVGCGIAGFSEDEMKEIFKGESPKNIIMPAGWRVIKGFKAFDKDLKCRGFQYEFGKDFYYKGEIELCASGFHFCKSLGSVYNYYQFSNEVVVCEVESEGDVIDEVDGDKSVTNHLRILRMLNAEEKNNNNGFNNLGHSNTGHRNTGHSNTGDRNTGDWNTGHSNAGNWNTGHSNTGHSNTGNWNTGNWNTGHSNAGDRNTGNWNTGNWNTGHSNAGHSNTGDRNTGDWNTGHSNAGHSNTGNWNTSNFNTGSFNTDEIKEVLVFNKPCQKEDWDNAIKPSCLYFSVNEWVDYEDMTEEEKVIYKTSKYAGGFMRKINYKKAFTKSMQNAKEEDIELVKKLPNFDADVFEEISGFRIK
jgi:hypothetical protein